MAITKEFQEAVENGKLIRVRIMLKDIMLVDPTMNKFDEMLDYAKIKLNNLFDEHNEEQLNYDNNMWNEAYLNAQMVAVVNNFSRERVELLRNMVKYLYRGKVDRINQNNEKTNQIRITKKEVGIGMATVGTVATVAGVCAQQGVFIAGGIVVAAVGVGLIVASKED